MHVRRIVDLGHDEHLIIDDYIHPNGTFLRTTLHVIPMERLSDRN